MILWAVRIRWLGYDKKWHRHTTKWHKNSGEAWEEAEAFQRSIKSYESACGLVHKEERGCQNAVSSKGNNDIQSKQ